jgi:hypothetical protein
MATKKKAAKPTGLNAALAGYEYKGSEYKCVLNEDELAKLLDGGWQFSQYFNVTRSSMSYLPTGHNQLSQAGYSSNSTESSSNYPVYIVMREKP